MESRFVAAKRTNVSLSEVEERLPCPPGGQPLRKGKAVEDFGRSFPRKNFNEQGKAKKVNGRQTPIPSARQHDDVYSDSGDELDILTHASDSDASTAVQKKSKEKGKWKGHEQDGHVGGDEKPLRKKTLKELGINFKKNLKGNAGGASDLTPSNTNSPLEAPEEQGTNSQRLLDSWLPSPGRSQNLDSRKGPSTSRRMPLAKLPEERTIMDRPKPRPRQAKSPQSKPTTTQNARPQPRPRGSRSKAQTDSKTSAFVNAPPRSPARRHTVSEHRPFPLSPPESENLDPSKTRRSPPVEKPTPAAFPLLSPVASARPSEFPSLTPLSSPKERARLLPKVPKKVTPGSPKTRKTTAGRGGKDTNPFPLLSPLSSLPKNAHEASGKSKVKTKDRSAYICESEDEDSVVEEGDQPKAQPFPMNTQVLNSIGSHDTPPRAGPSRPGKRSSSDGTDTEQIRKRIRKGRADENIELPAFDDYTYDEDDDTLMISPSTDPRTLCPYCDSPLPSSPTSLLTRLLAATAKKSSPDPRITNPLGRKAPFTVFIAVCQRHRFESEILPEAEHKGWPKEIEWTKLEERVGRLKGRLKALVDDVGDDFQGCGDNEGQDEDSLFTDDEGRNNRDFAKGKPSPRSSCVFWREVMAEVKKKGARAMAGVRGQFASFEKTQPGYYGEVGSVIIHQTLYDLFPPASIDPNGISPLTVNEFIQRILVPEVGVRLIMEDQGLEGEEGMKTAVSVLRESASYGVAMFPEDGGEWDSGTNGRGRRGRKAGDADEMGVADRIVMERARKRRKELEEEAEQAGGMGMEIEMGELQVVSDMEAEDEKPTRPRLRKKKELELTKKCKDKAQETEPLPVEPLPPRPKPRPLSKSASSASVLTSGKNTDSSLQSMDEGVDSDISEKAATLQRRLKGKPPDRHSPTISDLAQQTDTESDAETKVTTRLAAAISSGSTFLDLCSTDDDADRKDARFASGAKGAQRRHGMVANKAPAPECIPEADGREDDAVELVTPVIQRISQVSVELDCELEETPRPRASGRSCESRTPSVSDANFHPLAAARERRKRSGSVSSACPSTPSTTSWTNGHSWLLSDSSQSLD